MAVTLSQKKSQERTRVAVIDCDIHNEFPSEKVLSRYLSERWRRHLETIGYRKFPGEYLSATNPKASRTDSWPPPGGPPGSDLQFMRRQLLDRWNLEHGILNPFPLNRSERNLEYAAAISRAHNDWIVAEWLDIEPRLRSSIVVAYEDADLAVAEIDRVANDRRFVQILLLARTSEPLGRRKYWKIHEAAVRHNLPIAIHVAGRSGGPITGAGWPSYYAEHHGNLSMDFQVQVISLISEGVFARLPTLKIVLVECGLAWLPALMWRLDRTWRMLGEEVPHVRRLPSEYIREHFWISTQPIEEPRRPEQFHQLLDQLNMNDHLLFATDYPHWDFDAPDRALPADLSPDLKQRIMADNARALYDF